MVGLLIKMGLIVLRGGRLFDFRDFRDRIPNAQ
jgi:hypothetical protein